MSAKPNRCLFHAGHYNMLAKRIREARAAYEDQRDAVKPAIDMIVNDCADWFAEDNPRFERDTWMEATCTKD